MRERRFSPSGDPLGPEEGGDVSAFEKALDQAVRQRAEVESLVSKRSH